MRRILAAVLAVASSLVACGGMVERPAMHGHGGGGGGGVAATRTSALLGILGVSAHGGDYASLNGATTANIVSDAQYLGITKWRDGLGAPTPIYSALYAAGISTIAFPWTPSDSVVADQISYADTVAALGPGALFALEGPNEPGNFGFNYGGSTGGGASWAGVASWQSAWHTAVHADTNLAGISAYSPSLVGQEVGNYGLQYMTVPAGPPSGVLSAAGTVFADGEDLHVYPMYQGHAQPVDQSADSFVVTLTGDFVTTYAHGFAGQTLAAAKAQPKIITEFGYPATGGTAGGVTTDIPTQGKAILNGLMNAWNEGYTAFCIYTFYEDAADGGAGFGVLNGPGNPKVSGTYLHNLTTPLKDAGATAKTFTPGSLAYTIGGMPTNGKSLLFQKSNGNFELVLWNNIEDWNFSAGTPITISPTTVTVTFAATEATINTYDPVSGSTPATTASNATSVSVSLTDHPLIVEVIPSLGGTVCPYAGTASTDGCNGAPTANANTVQHSNFFTSYALQSGQTYTEPSFTGSISGGVLTISGASGSVVNLNDTIIGSSIPAGVFISSLGSGSGGNGTYNLANALGVSASGTMNGLRRPPWNVAGVDYPVGICKGTDTCANGFSGTLIDPATLPPCSGAWGSWGTTCRTYGSSNYTAYHYVLLTGTNPVVNGINFAADGGWILWDDGLATGTVTIENSKFCGGQCTNFQPGGDLYVANNADDAVQIIGSTVSHIIFRNNYGDFGANAPPYGGQASQWINVGYTFNPNNTTQSNTDVTYSVMLNANDRYLFGMGTNFKFNYNEGEAYNSANLHGEIITLGNQLYGTGNTTIGMSTDIEYNTFLQPFDYTNGMTTGFYLSNGDHANSIHWTTVVTSNNVMVNNPVSMPVSANTGTTFTWSVPQMVQFNIPANQTICSTIKNCVGTMTSQVSGVPSGSGTWDYTGTILGGGTGTAYYIVEDVPLIAAGGTSVDWSAATWTCQRNYIDNSGTLFGNVSGWSHADACYDGYIAPVNSEVWGANSGGIAMPQ